MDDGTGKMLREANLRLPGDEKRAAARVELLKAWLAG